MSRRSEGKAGLLVRFEEDRRHRRLKESLLSKCAPLSSTARRAPVAGPEPSTRIDALPAKQRRLELRSASSEEYDVIMARAAQEEAARAVGSTPSEPVAKVRAVGTGMVSREDKLAASQPLVFQSDAEDGQRDARVDPAPFDDSDDGSDLGNRDGKMAAPRFPKRKTLRRPPQSKRRKLAKAAKPPLPPSRRLGAPSEPRSVTQFLGSVDLSSARRRRARKRPLAPASSSSSSRVAAEQVRGMNEDIGEDIEDIEEDHIEDPDAADEGHHSDPSHSGTELAAASAAPAASTATSTTTAYLSGLLDDASKPEARSVANMMSANSPGAKTSRPRGRRRGGGGGNGGGAAERLAQAAHRGRSGLLRGLVEKDLWQSRRQEEEEEGADGTALASAASDPWDAPAVSLFVEEATQEQHLLRLRARVVAVTGFAKATAALRAPAAGASVVAFVPRRAGLLADSGTSPHRAKRFRAGRDTAASGGISGSGGSGGGGDQYKACAPVLARLGHLEGVTEPCELVNALLTLHWPWAFVAGVIISPSLLSVKQLKLQAPPESLGPACETPPPATDSTAMMLTQPSAAAEGGHENGDRTLTSERKLLDDDEGEVAAAAAAAAEGDGGRDGWDVFGLGKDGSVTKTVPRLVAVVECAVLREALLIDGAESVLASDSAPPHAAWSSVLLRRPVSSSIEQRSFCELLVPPQHVMRLIALLAEDSGSRVTLSGCRQVASRPLTHGASPTLLGRAAAPWSSFVAQRHEAVSNVMHVLCVDDSTSVVRVAATAETPPRGVQGLVHCGDVEPRPPGTRVTALCRVLHSYGNLLFVVDAADASRSARCLVLEDRRLARSLFALCAKGDWILCREVRWATPAAVLDSLTVVEKVIVTATQDPLPGAGILRACVDGDQHTLAWSRPPSAQCCMPTTPNAAVVPGRPDVKLEVPLLQRVVHAPSAVLRADRRARLLPLLELLERLERLEGLEGGEQQEQQQQLGQEEWHLASVAIERLEGVGTARKVSPAPDVAALGQGEAWVPWVFTEAAAMLSVHEALHMTDGVDLALAVRCVGGVALRIRMRYYDLFRLAGHAEGKAGLDTALSAGEEVPCLFHKSQLAQLVRERASFEAAATPPHVTSLSLFDEDHTPLAERSLDIHAADLAGANSSNGSTLSVASQPPRSSS